MLECCGIKLNLWYHIKSVQQVEVRYVVSRAVNLLIGIEWWSHKGGSYMYVCYFFYYYPLMLVTISVIYGYGCIVERLWLKWSCIFFIAFLRCFEYSICYLGFLAQNVVDQIEIKNLHVKLLYRRSWQPCITT